MYQRIDRQGNAQCLYGEAIDLGALGILHIQRASHVEPDETGHWYTDLAPVGGPRLGPFGKRSQALEAETVWLHQHLFADQPEKEKERKEDAARSGRVPGVWGRAPGVWSRFGK
jgi:hypothetical protein